MRSLDDLIAESGYDPDDPLLTPVESAERLRVSAETVRRWIRKNKVAAVHIGPNRRPRLRASVVAAMLRGEVPMFHAEH